MNTKAKIGASGELTFVVGPEHVIDFAEGGMPSVLSTPRLIALLERTAREMLRPWLDPDERSVGIEIEIRHLAPTPLGQSVTCFARVIQSEGNQFSFHIEARDEHEPIARGYHKRQVIRVDRFAKRVQRKQH